MELKYCPRAGTELLFRRSAFIISTTTNFRMGEGKNFLLYVEFLSHLQKLNYICVDYCHNNTITQHKQQQQQQRIKYFSIRVKWTVYGTS